MYREFQARGLVIVGVSIDEDRNAFERAVAKAALPWPQVFEGGDNGPLVHLFNCRNVPVSYLIDADGKIAAKVVTGVDLRTKVARALQHAATAESSEERRAKALKLPEILDALALSEGSKVADVGAGDGFLTPRLAKIAGPAGRVYAVDVDDKHAIPKLKELVEKQSLSNVTVIRSEPGDPKLPEGSLDAIIMLIFYHEGEPYQEMLKHVFAALKPGGRFVIVDNTPLKTRKRPRADQAKNHVIAPEVVEPELRAAGFEIATRRDDFIDRPDAEETKWMIVCRRPSR